MAQKILADAKWSALREEMRQIMVETARRGQLITYSELCAALKTAYLHYHSPILVRLLTEVGRSEVQAGRPVLPAVVVGKQSGIPGPGYFKVGEGDAEAEGHVEPKAMWEADLEQVFEYWSKH
ncbi:MAG: hypothetical protein R3E39_14295 [Anaerolineae bacterium]